MLEDVKDALRENGNDSDSEILDLIESAKLDLEISGVEGTKIIDTDPLIKRAIILYCKAHCGYEDVNMSLRLQEAYISLKQHLSLSKDYNGVV